MTASHVLRVSSAKHQESLTIVLLATYVLKNQMLIDPISKIRLSLVPLVIIAQKEPGLPSCAQSELSPTQLLLNRSVNARCVNLASTAIMIVESLKAAQKVPIAQ